MGAGRALSLSGVRLFNPGPESPIRPGGNLRIIIRTSKWAIWSRRLASFSLPLVVIPVLLHRERLIDADTFHLVAAIACAVALMALVAALVALVRLWYSGDQGWGRAVSALVVSLICLAPFGWAGWMATRYPPVTDVATFERAALPLVLDAATSAMRPPVPLPISEVETYFPNARTREYPLNALQAFELATRLVEAEGWQVRTRRQPIGPLAEGRINARAVRLMGWRDEIVLRIAGGLEGAVIDMRSVSLDAIHDLGANGLRIEAFLTALDTEVTTLMRDNPGLFEPDDDFTDDDELPPEPED